MFNMSEREYRLDVCPECKHREDDSSEKKLFQCRYCERWFCERHLEPRLAVIRDFNKIIKDKEWRDLVEEDWKREDGHPDHAYTRERFDELRIEKEILRSKIEAFLNKSRAYRKTVPREQYVTLGEHHICPRCGSSRTMTTAYREEYEAFQCLSCHYSWKEPRVPERSTFEKIPKEETEKLIETEEHEIRRIKRTSTWREIRQSLSNYLFSAILTLIGLGIVYWQVHSPALLFLIFYVIPIPAILIGIVLFFIGFLSSVGISVSMIKRPSISTKLVAVPLIFSLVMFSFFGFTVLSTMQKTLHAGTNLVDVNYVRSRVFDLINEERLNRNLPTLLPDTRLGQVAQVWSEDLARRSVLEHGNFEARMLSIEYGSYQCGEIIEQIDLQGIGFFQNPLERQFVDGWLGSTGHRNIMLMSSSGYIGIGIARNSGSIYAVADLRFD
jgi:ribosomal protein L37AE/L43A